MINIKQLMFDKALSQRQMAKIMNTTQSEVSQIGNGNRRILRKHIDGLIEYFGEDIVNQYSIPAEPFKPTTHTAEVTILNPETAEEIKAELRKEMRGDTIFACPHGDDCTKPIPFIGREIATAPNLNVRELVEKKSSTLEQFPMWKMLRNVDYIQTVITMAMAPRYLPGDYLFISFKDSQVLSGKIYLVDTRQYGTMLRHVYIEDGGYTLKASNPEFKPVFVKSEDVYSISSVVLSVNTNTSLASEINLAEMVRQRDVQMQVITAANSSMIEQQRELISEIRKQNDRLDRERESRDRLTEYLISKKL